MKKMKKMIGLLATLVLTFGLSSAVVRAADTNSVKDVKDVTKGITVSNMETLDNLQKLQKGYTINYRVIEDRDDPITITVSDSGELVIPYYEGLIKAAGKTCKQVAYDIKKELEKTHYKRATVLIGISSIAYTNTGTISVSGYVKMQGLQNLLPGETYTVSMAVSKAGGGTDFANLRKVKLTRVMEDGESRTFEINVKDVLEKGKLEEDMDVQPGDRIYVPQSYFRN